MVAALIHWAVFAGIVSNVLYEGVKGRPHKDDPLAGSYALTLRRFVPTSLRRAWYRALYDLDVELDKRPAESWQAWERRIAALHGVPVVTVLTRPAGSDDEVTADVQLTNPEEDSAGYQRLIDLVSSAEPDLTAPIPAAQVAFRQAVREHPYRTLWRITRVVPLLVGAAVPQERLPTQHHSGMPS